MTLLLDPVAAIAGIVFRLVGDALILLARRSRTSERIGGHGGITNDLKLPFTT